MNRATRRTFLGGTVGAATLLAGCPANDSSGPSGSFTNTAVSDQQLIVEFEESLDAGTISVIDPDGEGFAETSVTTGATRVSFEILMPYTPGEYRIVAAADGETVAETSQEIQPELEIVDVGVGANRMDEMPDDLGHTKDEEAVLHVKNSGNGPEMISKLKFSGDLPNPVELEGDENGIYDLDSRASTTEFLKLDSGEDVEIFSNTLPFSFEGGGVNCESDPRTGEMTVEIEGEMFGWASVEYRVSYTASDTYDGCGISIEEDS